MSRSSGASGRSELADDLPEVTEDPLAGREIEQILAISGASSQIGTLLSTSTRCRTRRDSPTPTSSSIVRRRPFRAYSHYHGVRTRDPQAPGGWRYEAHVMVLIAPYASPATVARRATTAIDAADRVAGIDVNVSNLTIASHEAGSEMRLLRVERDTPRRRRAQRRARAERRRQRRRQRALDRSHRAMNRAQYQLPKRQDKRARRRAAATQI